MSTKYAQHVSAANTPQSEPIPGKAMVPNSAGGFAFPVDDWTRLDRFLVLGNEAGTYYASEQKLTIENAACVLRCLTSAPDGPARVVGRIVEISTSGRAPKNDAAVFALALLASQGAAPPDAVRLALAALPRVCRTGTHLFQFVACQAQQGSVVLNQRVCAKLGLTPRQQQLVAFLARGLTNKEIAANLHLSEFTVKNHVHRIMRQLKADSRFQQLRFYFGFTWREQVVGHEGGRGKRQRN